MTTVLNLLVYIGKILFIIAYAFAHAPVFTGRIFHLVNLIVAFYLYTAHKNI